MNAPPVAPVVTLSPDNQAYEDQRKQPTEEERSAPAGAPAAKTVNRQHIYAALRELDARRRRTHVRVAWFGDSHGQADYWSGELRSVLQKRFGNGGPGFVHVGFKQYRHNGVRLSLDGTFRMHPLAPATRQPSEDGTFGIGGISFSGHGGGRAALAFTEAPPPPLRWDICFKLETPADGFDIHVDGRVLRMIYDATKPTIRHFEFGTEAVLPVALQNFTGSPTFCGLSSESAPETNPGVVVDTLGINGARIGTPLAWNENAFGAELKRRSPSLVILQYGTNESGDVSVKPSVYEEQLEQLVLRIRRTLSEADCLVIGPTERNDHPERTPIVNEAMHRAADHLGCDFFDTYAVMGGPGSMRKWQGDTPPRATPDGIHLNQRGYLALGAELARHILDGY